MKDTLTATKEQIKKAILEDQIFSPDDKVFEFVSAEFDAPDSTHVSTLENILNKFEDNDVIKGILLYGIMIGIDMGGSMEEDDFETDMCDCGCTIVH